MLFLTLASAAGALGLGAVAGWFFRRRRRDDETARDILRLASQIDAVAATVDADLEPAADDPPCVVLRQRSREARERATEALEQGRALRQQDREALRSRLLLLHDDHRRIVDLRSEVDRAMVRRKAARAGEDRCRIVSYGRPQPSRWSSSTLLTRPSTFS
ncbi:MAG TPA: LPXTG cell wall anchor domain-containing protein [Ramlibacter sp.]|uniref:LPXTG cell wall anchor domain-containing protein n=1 Tax=Ramlibacter sp. TaxID=1917967 RepID=UPI002D802C9E|nr:LPXTG cell wall anchor domain-containing protein [Ramlibacter sp.]HET8744864.1 LPXTG cell wall anchor domain-containing protein [Ramlibacter sp.]